MSETVEIRYADLKDTQNACYKSEIEEQVGTGDVEDDFLINLSDCNSSFTKQDQLDFQTNLASTLNDFFVRHNIETPDGVVQLVSSLTYGDMVICFLLFAILVVMILRWFWEVFRW